MLAGKGDVRRRIYDAMHNRFAFNNLRDKNSFTTLTKLCIIAFEFCVRANLQP